MANVQQIRKIIVQEALPQIPDTFSDAALDDGHPKADTFFESAREHLGFALRSKSPIVQDAIPSADFSATGPPKADTFFALAREHVGSALRINAPIVIYAVAVAAPALSVFVPLSREVVLPVASGNETLASMSSARRHQYMESSSASIYMFMFMNVIVCSGRWS